MPPSSVLPRALVFDFDGLIVDTETPLVEAWLLVHQEAGVPCDRAHALSIVGHADIPYDPWIAFPPQIDRTTLEHRCQHHSRRLLLAQPVLPGVHALLGAARTRGLPLGVASNSPHSWVDHHLRRIGLFDYFDVIRCRDDVAQGKPAPDIYLSAVRALGIAPHDAVAFEDSLPGSEAAHRAGLFCVVAPNPSTRHHHFPHAHWQVASLTEITLTALAEKMSARRPPPPSC